MMRTEHGNRIDELKPKFAIGLRRALAVILDIVPFGVLVAVLWPNSLSFSFSYLPLSGVSSDSLVAFLVASPVLLFLEASTGRTPGKFLLGIRVVNSAGEIPSLREATIRNFARIYDFGLTTFLLLPLILWDILVRRPLPGWASGAYRFAWSESGQRWGDELAGTYVIRGQWNPVRLGSNAPATSREQRGIRLSGRG